MTVKIRDAFSLWTFEKTPDGRALVTDAEGATGLFDPDGAWISGEVTAANPNMVAFVCGPHVSRELGQSDPGTRFARTKD